MRDKEISKINMDYHITQDTAQLDKMGGIFVFGWFSLRDMLARSGKEGL